MIELVSAITPKNNGNFAIAIANEIRGGLHSKATVEEMNAITTDRLDDGMLCYVSNEKKYYSWEDKAWQEFTVDSSNGNSFIYRVTTNADMDSIDVSVIEYGTLCHVIEDTNGKYLYYYTVTGWESFKPNHLVWIGNTPPTDKKALWIDTTVITHDENITIDNIPTFIDTPLMQYLISHIQKLQTEINKLTNRVEVLEEQVSQGWQPDNDNNIYLTTEDGYTIITEDGDNFITEDSNDKPTEEHSYLTTEDGYIITTEDGNSFVTEDSDSGSDSGGDNNTEEASYLTAEDGKILTAENGDSFIIEDNS